MRAHIASFLLLMVALSGCADEPTSDDPGTGADNGTGGSGGAPGIGDSEEQGVRLIGPISGTLYFTTAETLAVDLQAAGQLTLPASASSTWGQASDGQTLRFVSPVFDLPAIIQPNDLRVTFWVEPTVPIPASGFYDFGAWIGSTSNLGSSAVATFGPGVFTPGTQTKVTIEPNMPAKEGIYVPAGESFVVEVGSGLFDEDSGSLKLLVGPDHPSGVELTWNLLSQDILDGVSPAKVESFTGHVDSESTASLITGARAFPNAFDHPFSVPADAKVVRIDLSATSTGRSDVDMRVLDGSTVAGSAVSFHAREGIVLAGPTLEPFLGKELTLQVTVYLGSNVDYTADVHIG